MPKPAWLEKAVFYEIYPQTFFDSNGDGIGDLPGIMQKLEYLQYLGVNAVWLNPCFASPFQDAGYDVSDYYEVAPRYGTNADLQRLVCRSAQTRHAHLARPGAGPYLGGTSLVQGIQPGRAQSIFGLVHLDQQRLDLAAPRACRPSSAIPSGTAITSPIFSTSNRP